MNKLVNTNFNQLFIRKLDTFFKKQNYEVKIDIFSEKRNQYFKLKNSDSSTDNSVLELTSFYIAVNYFYTLNKKAMNKNKSMNTKDLKKFNDFSIKSINKKRFSKKESILLDKSSTIVELLKNKRSYRDISKYFRSYHRIEISHTYIRNVVLKYPQIFWNL